MLTRVLISPELQSVVAKEELVLVEYTVSLAAVELGRKESRPPTPFHDFTATSAKIYVQSSLPSILSILGSRITQGTLGQGSEQEKKAQSSWGKEVEEEPSREAGLAPGLLGPEKVNDGSRRGQSTLREQLKPSLGAGKLCSYQGIRGCPWGAPWHEWREEAYSGTWRASKTLFNQVCKSDFSLAGNAGLHRRAEPGFGEVNGV